MRNKAILLTFLLVSFFVSLVKANPQSNLDLNGKPIKFFETISPTDSEWVLVKSVIKNYEEKLIQAINSNDFRLVEPYLVKGSSLYNEQKRLVANLYAKGIKESLESFEIVKYDYQSKDVLKVFVVEAIEIKNGNKPNAIKEFQWIYTLQKSKSGLSKIERWADYENYVSIITGSAKTDGYYVDELVNRYASILIEAINTLEITGIKEIAANKEILEKHKQFIIKLRKMGLNFEVIDNNTSEINDDWKGKLIITFAYLDKNKRKNKLKQTIYFEFDEIRQGFYGVYGRAVIKEMSVLD